MDFDIIVFRIMSEAKMLFDWRDAAKFCGVSEKIFKTHYWSLVLYEDVLYSRIGCPPSVIISRIEMETFYGQGEWNEWFKTIEFSINGHQFIMKTVANSVWDDLYGVYEINQSRK